VLSHGVMGRVFTLTRDAQAPVPTATGRNLSVVAVRQQPPVAHLIVVVGRTENLNPDKVIHPVLRGRSQI